MTWQKILKYWLPFTLYVGCIVLGSSIPKVKTPFAAYNFDKVIHLGEYIPFGFLLYRALGSDGDGEPKGLLILAVLLTLLFALTDELHQYFVPGRVCDLLDATADTVGGALGAWLYLRRTIKS
jgi:VanZ family protein